jgi:hypothetical protein
MLYRKNMTELPDLTGPTKHNISDASSFLPDVYLSSDELIVYRIIICSLMLVVVVSPEGTVLNDAITESTGIYMIQIR